MKEPVSVAVRLPSSLVVAQPPPAAGRRRGPRRRHTELQALKAQRDQAVSDSLSGFPELRTWSDAAAGAFSRHTERACRADWWVFLEYCGWIGAAPYPASPEVVRCFLQRHHTTESEEVGPLPPRKAPATLRRYLSTITRIHKAGGRKDPCDDELVRLAMRAISRHAGREQRQAKAFNWTALERFLALPCPSVRDIRDRALLAMAYDSLGRTDELVRVDVEHLTRDADGSGTLHIERSKTDQEGEGADVYLSAGTMSAIDAWQMTASIHSGALWRIVRGKTAVLPKRMSTAAIAATFDRAALKLRLRRRNARLFSGHSARVGATQDMLAAGISPHAIMQAGRWKSVTMPALYGRRLAAKNSGMAQLAAAQGRVQASASLGENNNHAKSAADRTR